MNLNNGKTEVVLEFSTSAYMKLKAELKCDNLRKTLLQGCNKEDYEMLARSLKVFSGSKIATVNDAYSYIDGYCTDNGARRPDMFMQFIVELGENGFFGDAKTLEDVRTMAASPETEIDLEDLTGEAMKLFKGEMLHKMVQNMANDTLMTGAPTLKASIPQLMAAE